MKRKIIILTLVVVLAVVLTLLHIPKRIAYTMTVSDGDGKTAKLEVDILYFPNIILPSYVKGTLSVDGVAYIDQYTMHNGFRGEINNRLFPSDWISVWIQNKDKPMCNTTFVRSDCTDIISATQNRIDVLDIVLNTDSGKIHYMYLDESNRTDSHIEGISFWGPAQNAEEAKEIAAAFGYCGTGR